MGQTIGGLKNPEYYNPYKNYTWDRLVNKATGKIQPNAKAAWNENWMDEISNETAFRTEHILSVSGGTAKSSYLYSMGYYKENGTLQNTDFDRFDYIIVMDDDNYLDITQQATNDQQRSKVLKMKDYFVTYRGSNSVPDPYYGDAKDFERALDLIEDGCRGLLDHLL